MHPDKASENSPGTERESRFRAEIPTEERSGREVGLQQGAGI